MYSQRGRKRERTREQEQSRENINGKICWNRIAKLDTKLVHVPK